ncbi:leucyl aminopeptidase [Geosporobacter ferrireducens]|uniref:Probable cytosol aminopeptidase n=1 Tax=Geosporobacter ferrireducens TaxID=1424294 RepID=A0A1D8GJE5_9FIRM|nr:leucyl aminopeptidase [Geosporobacter ferrireducens]AOT71048.1 leucyl aminopeptidase [Geosporobacter ferrireducens]MTI58271.1 leucyl aminopeptidase [Geosporobacter ferrireducens]
MEFRVVRGALGDMASDSLVLCMYRGIRTLSPEIKELDRQLGGVIGEMIITETFEGKAMEVQVIHTLGRITPKNLILAGLGEEEKVDEEILRNVLGSAVKTARKLGNKKVAFCLEEDLEKKLCPVALGQSLAEGVLMALYRFDKYKSTEKKQEEIEEVFLLKKYAVEDGLIQKGIQRGTALGKAVNLTRDLVNEPGNRMTPTVMAGVAKKVAVNHGMRIEILEKEDMEKLGMHALIGVAKGSAEPPKLIVMEYNGGTPQGEKIALVGKGITFDAGGISIKPAQGMEEMKDDMAGGAAVIGAMDAIGALKPQINIIAIIPACENLPSGTAQKPGDVVKSMSGKTIEIINTDAEGRLILVDAITYAIQKGADKVIDIATLTGACVVALGHVTTGALANNEALWLQVKEAAARAGDKIWQMPAFEEYKELIKSDIADIKNTGGRWAGMITAGLFIGAFVEKKPWVHIDIAGTVSTQKERGYRVKGPTGVGVRTLAHLAEVLAVENIK